MLGLLTRGADDRVSMTIREMSRAVNAPIMRAEGLGWDLPALWGAVCDGLAAGVAAAAEAGARVRGIGVDSWGVDYGRLTADGALRAFARHHRDVDTVAAAADSAARDAARDYAITGVLDQAINTTHQLRQDAADGIGAASDTILPIADMFVYLLTGRIGAEVSLASTTALLDRTSGDWSPTVGGDLPAMLPPVVETGSAAGHTTAEVTEMIGASAPVPVWAVTAHDTAAAFMAVVGPDEPGTGVVSSGSWSVVGVASHTPLLDDRVRRAGFTQERGHEGATLLVKNLSGMWLLQQALREWAVMDAATPGTLATLHDLLAAAATSRYPGRFDPSDPALQAPDGLLVRLEEACAAGGYRRPEARADLVRAIVDSLAAAYADALAEVAGLTGRTIERVRIVGGGARNDLLCDLTARRTGLPVVRGPVEASVQGVLLQAAIAAGDLPDAAAARVILIDHDLHRPSSPIGDPHEPVRTAG